MTKTAASLGSAVFFLSTPGVVAGLVPWLIGGWYRYVRNPMYVAVLGAIFGQALLFGNRDIALYGAGVWVLFHGFVVLYEEPALSSTYGASYAEFCRRVPRWVPRFKLRIMSASHGPGRGGSG